MVLSGGTAVLQWEYQSITRAAEGALLEALNEAGKEGWELVSTAHYRDLKGIMCWTAILKRPVAGLRPALSAAEGTAAVAPAPAGAKAETPTKLPAVAEEETDFDLNLPTTVPAKPAAAPRTVRAAPPRTRIELSDDFDFELSVTTPTAAQPTRQVKTKPQRVVLEDDFDFELGESFPIPSQPAKKTVEKPKPQPEDETDFDLG